MDWTKQTEEVVKSWTETQKKMWDSWLKTVQQGPEQFQVANVWQKTMETWEETVKNTMAAQGEWMQMWVDGFEKQKGMPEEATQWVKQAQTMNKQWTDIQQQMWDSWFELVKKADPAKMTESLDSEGKKAFAAWQESAEKVMEAQEKWANMWTAAVDKAAEAGGKK
ncbi:MAG: hypothetical protein KDF65_06440 [Anaerolineae bacterium]|nr:hypothetical protein [Anaerolineae bacterium]